MKNIISGVVVFFILFSLGTVYSALRPIKITSNFTPQSFGVSYEKVLFETKDHVLIHGWFVPHNDSHAKTIILMHGYPADKGNILPSTIFLHQYYNLLYFDFRYLGENKGSYSTIGKNEVLDLLAAIHYLNKRHIEEVGVWGFSLGGAVALMTSPLTSAIKAIVAEASYARLDWMAYDYYRIPFFKYILGTLSRFWVWLFFHYDIKDVCPACSAEKITVPVLLINSKNDNVVSYENALLLQKALKNNTQAEVIIEDTLRHGQHFKNYQPVVEQFFKKYLADNLENNK